MFRFARAFVKDAVRSSIQTLRPASGAAAPDDGSYLP